MIMNVKTIKKRSDPEWIDCDNTLTLNVGNIKAPITMHVIGEECFHPDTPKNCIFGFSINTYHNKNIIEIGMGSLGPTDNSPAFNVGIHHIFKFKSLLEIKPEKNTWYHLFIEWNDYGEYRFFISKDLKLMKRKFAYFRRLSSLLTTKTCRLKSLTQVGTEFIWKKQSEKNGLITHGFKDVRKIGE